MGWALAGLDKNSPVPLYYQLAELIRERVRSGALRPGDQLPSERELGEQAGISRMTARQALGSLLREGVLVVRHGVGTFVAEPKLTYDALNLLGFTEETVRHGGVVGSRVLEQAVVAPPPAVAAALGMAPGEEVIRVVRLRSSGETPLLLETSAIPAALCPGLEREDLEAQSLYALLEVRYGLRLGRARQTLEATVASEYERELFGVRAGTPMLLLEGVTFVAPSSRPMQHFTAVYRGDRLRFELESHRAAGGDVFSAQPRVSVVPAR